MTNTLDSVKRATECAGSQAALARILDVTPPTVNQWCKGQRPVPNEMCIVIERATLGVVRCEELNPDEPWRRVPDAEWPHPDGRPVLDYAARHLALSTAPAAQEPRHA